MNMEMTPQGLRLTRRDLLTLADAIEEFRDESGCPHIQQNREDAEQLRELLGDPGDEWLLVPGL